MTTKNKNISLSYAVTVHNETDTLKELLNTLTAIKDKNDELIIYSLIQPITHSCNVTRKQLVSHSVYETTK